MFLKRNPKFPARLFRIKMEGLFTELIISILLPVSTFESMIFLFFPFVVICCFVFLEGRWAIHYTPQILGPEKSNIFDDTLS